MDRQVNGKRWMTRWLNGWQVTDGDAAEQVLQFTCLCQALTDMQTLVTQPFALEPKPTTLTCGHAQCGRTFP